jgi:hypothetical protein
MGGPQAPAAGALEPEERPEETGRIEAGRGGIEEVDDDGGSAGDQEERDRRPSDACMPMPEDVGPPPTPARTA